jgi:hypothetical protein
MIAFTPIGSEGAKSVQSRRERQDKARLGSGRIEQSHPGGFALPVRIIGMIGVTPPESTATVHVSLVRITSRMEWRPSVAEKENPSK